jgi:hypothetical protein
MSKEKDSEVIKHYLSKIFDEYEKILNNTKIDLSKYLNNNLNIENGRKINLNISINIKKENYLGSKKPINKMKMKILKFKNIR